MHVKLLTGTNANMKAKNTTFSKHCKIESTDILLFIHLLSFSLNLQSLYNVKRWSEKPAKIAQKDDSCLIHILIFSALYGQNSPLVKNNIQ